MSEYTKQFVDNLIDKDYMKARENLKSAVEETLTRQVEDAKENVRATFSDE